MIIIESKARKGEGKKALQIELSSLGPLLLVVVVIRGWHVQLPCRLAHQLRHLLAHLKKSMDSFGQID